MFLKIFYIFPQIALLLGVLHLSFMRLIREDTSKYFAYLARFWLLVSFFCSVFFYDKSINAQYFENNAYTLLFNLGITIFAYEILGLAPQWFIAQKKIGCRYYVFFLLAIAIMNLFISSINLITTLSCYILLSFINYRLLSINYEKKNTKTAIFYIMISMLMLFMFIAGVGLIYFLYGKIMDYQTLRQLYMANTTSFLSYLSLVFIIIPFLYALNIAPFHILTEEKVSKSILPVSQYLTLIVPIVYWGAFIKINTTFVITFAPNISWVYMCFAILSVIWGGTGVNARINLHRIYAQATMYYFGVILLLLSYFKPEANFSACLYLLTYLLSINGVYLVFYSLKSRNEYLSSVTSLSGLAETRPYATATLFISLFSLIGFPPLAGFLGQVYMMRELVLGGNYINIAVVFFSLLFLAKAYWEIIKTAYFEKKIVNFDTENHILWVYMLINIISLIVITFNPFNVIDIIQDMFYVIFL